MANNCQNIGKSELNKENKLGNLEPICALVEGNVTLTGGRNYDSLTLIRGAIATACSNNSISGFAKMTEGLPSHTTCLKKLHGLNMEELTLNTPKMLLKAGKGILKKGQEYDFAIDITLIPYYGKKDKKNPKSPIVGGKRKASTNYFVGYLTFSVVNMDKHLILQVIPLFRDSTNLTAIKNCVDLIYGYGFKIKSLMLDREFYSAEIFSYLKESEIPHIVPVKKNSDELKRQLKGKKSKSFEYVINAKSKNKLKCKVKIVDRVIYMKGKKGKKGALHRAFVVYKINTSPQSISERYRHRFAIESTYVINNKFKVRTSTKDHVVRFFYYLIACIIQNFWVLTKWKRFAKIQRGPKVIDRDKFPLNHYLAIIFEESMTHFRILRIDEIAIS